VTPNGYLYNDIWLGDIDVTDESAAATGAVVNHHPEGILIDRTPARGIAAAMAAAVPYVQQING
jgi:serine acetyltransferase